MAREIPTQWKTQVREHILKTRGQDRDSLSAYDFDPNRNVHLRFPDGSYALFRYAFYLTDVPGNEVAVFTEHCGYHLFPLSGLVIERFEPVPAADTNIGDQPGSA